VSATVQEAPGGEARGWRVVLVLGLGYIGVYLCRKNLSVAVPLLQQAFGATKAQVGTIASVGTVAYAIGKMVNGLIVDRVGGRRGFLTALVAVALFGATGALAPGIAALAMIYALNRFAGAAGWGAMLKLVPSWFRPSRTGTVVGVLSLSYVAGGILAVLLAREVVRAGYGWRAVMGVPSVFAIGLAVICALFVRQGPLVPADDRREHSGETHRVPLRVLFENRQFLITCVLSLTVTLMRESFNTWSIDFLVSMQRGTRSVAAASLQSIWFDLAGFVSILFAGVAYDRVRASRRRWLISGSLLLLAVVIAILPAVATANLRWGTVLVGLAGLLVYGPYSLLAGTLAVESGGAERAATAAGFIDGIGYVASILAGTALGGLLDLGGYSLGFGVLAAISAVSAGVGLALHPGTHSGTDPQTA
jgi:sugar phosphate permease